MEGDCESSGIQRAHRSALGSGVWFACPAAARKRTWRRHRFGFRVGWLGQVAPGGDAKARPLQTSVYRSLGDRTYSGVAASSRGDQRIPQAIVGLSYTPAPNPYKNVAGLIGIRKPMSKSTIE